ncbi:MAG: zinc-ribbon domain-containing protein [Bradyrhizobium sp.]
MKMSDVTCPSCAASYELAESMSAKGNPGRATCSVCGGVLASWPEPRLRAYRLVLPPEHKYPSVPVPPSPTAS